MNQPTLAALLTDACPAADGPSAAPDQRPVRADRRQAAMRRASIRRPIISSPSAAHGSRGFTLIETMVATAISAILSGVAYPSFTAQVQKARRADATLALQQVQMAQERWRANHAGYATLSQLGLASTSPSGHYVIDVVADASGYRIGAQAAGSQARDAACRSIRLQVDGANTSHASGTDASSVNPEAQNRACWSL